MLRQLEAAWRDPSASLDDAVDTMRALSGIAAYLVARPRPDGRGTYGPCFRLV